MEVDTYDFNSDGVNEIVFLTRNGISKYGKNIIIVDIKNRSIISHDFKELQPWKIEIGRISDENILSLGLNMRSPLHDEKMDKIFMYSVNEDYTLKAFFRSSKTLNPLCDFILYDLDDDYTDEIITIEKLSNGNRIINSYRRHGFGFYIEEQSGKLEKASFFRDGRYLNLNDGSDDLMIPISELKYEFKK